MQQGILFHTLQASQSGVYVVQHCYTFSKTLNLPAFQQAWKQVIDRHPILRTSFYWKQHKEPFQIVHKSVDLPWQQYDWEELSVTAQQDKLEAFLVADYQQGFNISQAPLMRLTSIQIAADTYHFIWTNHHLILDGWSTALVLQQVFQAYEALCHGQVFPLPHCRPYTDYIAWLQQQNLNQAEAFWRQALKGFTAPTQLRIGNTNPVTGCGEQSIKLSPATTAALQSLVRQHKLTLNTFLQGVWAILLSRYSGEDDVVFGATSAGRPPALTGYESMVGLFINTLPVRVQVSGNELLIPWLQKLQAQQIEAQQYEYSPLVQVQGWSEVPRNLPLFESILVFENYPVDASLKEWATEMQIHNIRSVESTNYPITLLVGVGTLTLQILSDRSRFDAATITRMLGHLQTLLEGMVANPHQSLSSLPLLTAAELHQQLVEWNHTQTQYPQDKCIHQLFEEQVEKTPDAVAIVFENEQLTYRELNQRANQLAHYLQKLGVQPEAPVCICVERSLEMIVGLLGILKAGGAYVPLDPGYPQERLEYIKQDVRSPLLLTQHKLKLQLFDEAAQVICLDTDWEKIKQHSQENLVTVSNQGKLAYVIYTSGSTGNPKGVEIAHGNVVNFLNAMQQTVELQQQDVLLAVTTLAFDIAALEIFLPLIIGGRVAIASREVVSDGVQLSALLLNSQATVMQATPATWRMLLAAGWQGNKQLKILCGGEALPRQLANQLLQQCHSLWNLYGPTETTIWSTVHQVEFGDKPVSIGRPIANTQVYILDSQLQPTPIGVPGELYIAGAGIARGYWHRPELTDQRFIDNPFTIESEQKLYKTGDLARYLSDRNIEYLGRLDHQVKIRGFRIELGEIEAVLAKHQDVLQAVAIANQDYLVAYVVARLKTPTVDELRDFLKHKLPYYMVPNTFVFLESLPLTPNGKVNRKALPATTTAIPEREKFREPGTSLEKELVAIWSEILHVQQISIDDNFFDLGGHSLLIVQLFARIRAAFQIDLPLQTLFEAPTVETLAAKLEIAHYGQSSTVTTANPTLNLKAEAVLDPAITAEGKPIDCISEPACIFLTGATGFLGAFLLDELLQQTQADIYCLVRAANAEEGKQKIRRSLESYLIWNESQSSRIIPVLGDLSVPLLGLSQAQFTALAKKLDVIYHNGAWVHHASPYSTLKAANVLGTQEILRLASQIKIKSVHFISTTSVFSAPVGSGMQLIREQSSLDDTPAPENGYAQSKWVAEQLVTIARKRGLPVCIYRTGRISGDSKTGAFNPNDFLYRLLIGCIQLGSIPNGEFIEGLLPVDYVSKAIIHLSQQQQSLGKAFHLLNPQLLDLKMLFNSIRLIGYPLQQISHNQWYSELVKIAENYPEHPLYPLIPFFITSNQTQNLRVLKFDCENTLNELAKSSIYCPEINEKLLNTYISYLINSNFIHPQQPRISL